MKKLFFLFLITIPLSSYCQSLCNINLVITDSVVYTQEFPNATKLNVDFITQNLKDSLFIYFFGKYPQPHCCVISSFDKTNMGLFFIIENKDQNRVYQRIGGVQYRRFKDFKKHMESRPFVSSNQTIEYKQLEEKELNEYDLAKYVITKEKQNLELYPILNDIPVGEYYLYFIYSYHHYFQDLSTPIPKLYKELDESRIFKGYFVSNKVKLIIE